MKTISAWAPLAQQSLFRYIISFHKLYTTLRECRILYWGKRIISENKQSWPTLCIRKHRTKIEGSVFPAALNWPMCMLDSSHVQSCSALSWSHLHSHPPARVLVDVLCCRGTGFPASCTEEVQSLPAIPGQTAQAIICLYILFDWQEEWKCLQPSSKWMNAKSGVFL